MTVHDVETRCLIDNDQQRGDKAQAVKRSQLRYVDCWVVVRLGFIGLVPAGGNFNHLCDSTVTGAATLHEWAENTPMSVGK